VEVRAFSDKTKLDTMVVRGS